MAVQDYSEEEIVERLHFDNPWWQSGKLEPPFSELPRRQYLQVFQRLVTNTDFHRAVVLMGSRRVGKTVLLLHTIQHLIDSGVSPHRICYMSLDVPIYSNLALDRLFKLCRKTVGNTSADGYYVFFDEIQYLEHWEQHLKTLVDSYPNVRFVGSGSAGAALVRMSRESGAGRFTDFALPALSFAEYVEMRNPGIGFEQQFIDWGRESFGLHVPSNQSLLNELFVEYINFGGYPELLFRPHSVTQSSRYIQHDIVEKVLLRDLPSLYGIQNVMELNKFFNVLAYNSGNVFSFAELKRKSQIDPATIRKYLDYLQAAFLIHILERVDENSKTFKRVDYFKVYLTNTSLRTALFSPVREASEFMGNLVETALLAQYQKLDALYLRFAHWTKGASKGEVDLVQLNRTFQKPAWILEAKWSNRYVSKPRELRSLVSYCQANKVNKPLVTSIDKMATATVKDIDLTFVPASSLAYSIGKHAVAGTLPGNL